MSKKSDASDFKAELESLAERMGYEIVAEYKDEGISGAKKRTELLSLNEMMKDAVREKF